MNKKGKSITYSNATIYVLTGTGNSHRVARWLGEWAEQAGMTARVVPMDGVKPREEVRDEANQLVGLVYPTHGFTAIWRAITFAAGMPRVKRAKAFAIATRAGTKFGRIFLPGIGATAPFIVALILRFKGYCVRGVTGLDMPSNWTAIHPGFKEKNARAIIERTRPRAKRFADRLLSGGTNWWTRSNTWDAVWAVPLAYVALMYLLVGRFLLAKLFFTTDRCNGCKICAEECPVGAIRMVGTKKSRPFWRWNCESCMRCMNYCPERAIEASHSWAVVVFFLMSIPASMCLMLAGADLLPGITQLEGHWLRGVIDFSFAYPAIFLSYYVLYGLSRVPLFNAILAHTTLTRIYRRYREPDTKRNQIVVRRKSE